MNHIPRPIYYSVMPRSKLDGIMRNSNDKADEELSLFTKSGKARRLGFGNRSAARTNEGDEKPNCGSCLTPAWLQLYS
jgi:hypothetical protein